MSDTSKVVEEPCATLMPPFAAQPGSERFFSRRLLTLFRLGPRRPTPYSPGQWLVIPFRVKGKSSLQVSECMVLSSDDNSYLLVACEQPDFSHHFRLGIYSDLLFRRGVRHEVLILPRLARHDGVDRGRKFWLSVLRLLQYLWFYWFRLRRAMRRHDVVVMYRPVLFQGAETAVLLRRVPARCRVIVDIDDSLLVVDHHGGTRPEVERLIKRAKGVLVSNPRVVGLLNPSAEVMVVPDAVDLIAYSPRHLVSDADRTLVVGVVLPDEESVAVFEGAESVLRRVHPDIEFSIFFLVGAGVHPPSVPGIFTRVATLGPEEREAMSFFDCVIIPGGVALGDEIPLLQSARSPHALFRLMAMGIPSIVLPGLVVDNCIVNGVEGFLAGTPQQLEEALRSLLGDPAARRVMGAKARERAVRRFALEQVFRRWLGAVQGSPLRDEPGMMLPSLVSR